MPGKGGPPQAIPPPISRHIITCYVRYQGSKHTAIYILVQTIISVQAKLEVVRRKHIVHLTGFGAYSSTCYHTMVCAVFLSIFLWLNLSSKFRKTISNDIRKKSGKTFTKTYNLMFSWFWQNKTAQMFICIHSIDDTAVNKFKGNTGDKPLAIE